MTAVLTDPPTKKRAIIIVSIGERPWIGAVTKLFGWYAKRCHADLILETEAPNQADFPLPELPNNPGRPHKRFYACKSYFAWLHLVRSGYDQVLVLDDSCCVTPLAPDIFDATPPDHVGYVKTGRADAERSFEDIDEFLRQSKRQRVLRDHNLYMNSGVMVYGRNAADALAPDRIVAAQPLLFSQFPHQSLTYHLLRRAELPMKALDRKFNLVPAVRLPRDERRDMTDIHAHLSEKAFIYHVTGMYRRRDLLISQICNRLEEEWRAEGLGVPAAPRRPDRDDIFADAPSESVRLRAEVGELRAEIAGLRGKLSLLRRKLQENRERVQRLERRLAVIHGSVSWRVTAPMRWVRSRRRTD